jgi:tRNA pseudouridine38-40 synthase
MPRFRLEIEYAGTRYSGWQVQKNARTVQGELERAILEVHGRRGFELYGSGRTDAGVHALRQVAHVDLATIVPPLVLLRRVNDELPADINVLEIVPAPRTFHARHDAVSRSYLYQVARRRTAFAKPFVWWIRDDLSLERMRAAAGLFTGLRDYRSFTDDRPEEKSTRVLIDRVEVGEHGALLLIRVVGSHFLWKMVRRIVGVLCEAGRGGLSAEDVAGFLKARSAVPARLTAPASGLFLERVFYPGEAQDLALVPAFFEMLRGWQA